MSAKWAAACLGGMASLSALGCGSDPATNDGVATTQSALKPWVDAEFQQVFRPNQTWPYPLGNRCELTIPLASPKPLTFIASDPLGANSFPSVVSWNGSDAFAEHLSVTACVGEPCVRAVYKGVWANDTGVRCQIVADDGSSRIVGKSTGNRFHLDTPLFSPTGAMIARQSVKLGQPGQDGSGMCVLRQDSDFDFPSASSFAVSVNGVQQTDPINTFQIIGTWPTRMPSPGFGSLFQGWEGFTARAKHVTPLSEHLGEGDRLQCAGSFGGNLIEYFNLNVSPPMPGGGISIERGATGWTCAPTKFGTGDGCDCTCGIKDPDCGLSECAPSAAPIDDFWMTGILGPLGGFLGVEALALDAGVLYVGGNYDSLLPPIRNFGVLDATTGDVDTTQPDANGSVTTAAPDGSGGWYIGGAFTEVDGVSRTGLAHITAAGALDLAFSPQPNGNVNAIAVSGGVVFVGGSFTNVGGQARNRIAALDPSTGLATTWNADADNTVNALAISGSTLYVGGQFTTLKGQQRLRIAAVDTSTSTLSDWAPEADGTVKALAITGTAVYAGGIFTIIGGQSRNRIAALDPVTGAATTWNPNANAEVSTLAVSGTTVYAGGMFTTIGAAPVARNGIAAINAIGNATAWNPNPNGAVHALALDGSAVLVVGEFTQIGGQVRRRVAAIDSAGTGTATSWVSDANSTVYTVAVGGSSIAVGGLFSSVGAVAQADLAAFDVSTGAPTAWAPILTGTAVHELAAANGVVYVAADNGITALDAGTGAQIFFVSLDGRVWSFALSGNTLYVAGEFNTLGGAARYQLGALDATTGAVTSWDPEFTVGNAAALAVNGDRVYVGGSFSSIGGVARQNLAALDENTGALVQSWAPNPNGGVGSLAVSGDTLYVGGGFTSIGGQTRNRLAAVDLITGNALAFDPNVDFPGPNTLAVANDTVYVGGWFLTVGGQARGELASVDAITGALTAWDPNPSQIVYSIAVGDDRVYAGGSFTMMGGSPRYYIAAFEQ